MQIVPLSQTANQSLQVVLDGQYLTMDFYTRAVEYEDYLFCNITVEETPLVRGLICQDFTPLVPYSYLNFRGDLRFLDMQGESRPHYSGLNDRFLLTYRTEAEMQELEG